MKNFTFLVLQGPDGTRADLAPLVDYARTQNGRLNVMHIGPVPIMVYSIGTAPYAAPIIPEGWIGQRNDMAEVLAGKQADTREYLQNEGITGEVSILCVEPAALHDLVAIRALFADICIVQDSLRDNDTAFDNILYGLLYEAPAPVIINVDKAGKALAPENIFVAWNSSLPVARAVHAALPILKAAKEVTVACFDPDPSKWADGDNPGADVASWLSHHGCKVTVQEYATGRKYVADAIIERAQECTADLVVMGAYGRSRWNEWIFGGTTQHMFKQRDIAVLMTH